MIKTLISGSLLILLNSGEIETNQYLFNIYQSQINSTQKSFDESQLIGNWYFLSKDNDSKSKSENLMDEKFITIKLDHKFDSDIFENMKSGNWSFDKETQILTLKSDSENSKWLIKNVNDFGMVLINLETNEKWMFAA